MQVTTLKQIAIAFAIGVAATFVGIKLNERLNRAKVAPVAPAK